MSITPLSEHEPHPVRSYSSYLADSGLWAGRPNSIRFSKHSMTWEPMLMTKEGTVYTVCSAAMVPRTVAPLLITEQDELLGP